MVGITREPAIIPKTDGKIDRSQIDSEVAHEDTLRYFVEHTELSVLTPEQMGVISLVTAYEALDIQLPATKAFFTAEHNSIKSLSSGEEGRGRIQAKECITAGAFPMSLLFGEKKSGFFDTVKSLWSGGKKEPEANK
jgi:hypothetical protein